MHDPTKFKLGATGSSAKEVSCHNVDPATFQAGLAVRLKSDGLLSVAKADGMLIGISLGKSLSDTKKTAVARSGSLIPIQLTNDEDEYAYVVKGAKVYIDDATGMANDPDANDGEDPPVSIVTVTDAVYVSGVLDGVKEDGTTVKVALVDMPGGL